MSTRVMLVGLAMMSAALMSAPTQAQSVSATGAYAVAPVSDTELAASTAMALPGAFARNERLLVDQNSQQFFQQVGLISRDAMDNWWAQTGASLIDNNLLAMPR